MENRRNSLKIIVIFKMQYLSQFLLAFKKHCKLLSDKWSFVSFVFPTYFNDIIVQTRKTIHMTKFPNLNSQDVYLVSLLKV